MTMTKLRLLILTLLICGNTMADARAEYVAGVYFAVIVSDVENSVEWYSAVLDLEVRSQIGAEGKYEIVNLMAPGIAVELLDLESAAERPQGYIRGAFKVGFFVEDLKAFIASLPGHIERPDVIDDERNELLLIQLRDPDNNIVQIMQEK